MKSILGHSKIRAALVLVVSAFALSACHYHGYGGHGGHGYGKGKGSYGYSYGKFRHHGGGFRRGHRFRHGRRH